MSQDETHASRPQKSRPRVLRPRVLTTPQKSRPRVLLSRLQNRTGHDNERKDRRTEKEPAILQWPTSAVSLLDCWRNTVWYGIEGRLPNEAFYSFLAEAISA